MGNAAAAHAVGVSKRIGKAWRNGRTRSTGRNESPCAEWTGQPCGLATLVGTDFSGSQARQSELDWVHAAQSGEPLLIDEFRLQDLIGRLVHCVVVGVTLLGERAIYVVKASSPCSIDGSECSFGPKN